jgi:hypothetical protein
LIGLTHSLLLFLPLFHICEKKIYVVFLVLELLGCIFGCAKKLGKHSQSSMQENAQQGEREV